MIRPHPTEPNSSKTRIITDAHRINTSPNPSKAKAFQAINEMAHGRIEDSQPRTTRA